MALDIVFYEAADPQLGGAIDTGDVLGSIASQGVQSAPSTDFPSTVSEVDGGPVNKYYKKFWVRNEEVVDVLAPYVYLDGLSDPTEVRIAREKAAGDTTTAVNVMPSGYVQGDFLSIGGVEDKIPLYPDTSDIAPNASVGFWLQFSVGPGQAAEQSTGVVRVVGTRG